MKSILSENMIFPSQVGCYLDEKEKLFCQVVFVLVLCNT